MNPTLKPSGQTADLPADVGRLSTAEISDALDALRLPGSVFGVGHVAGRKRLFGPAYTVRFAPVDTLNPGTVGDYLDETPEGAIVVLDNAGRMDCTVWGGILSQLAARRNIGGTVIHGVCRDTAEAEQVGYPLYARGRFMRTGKDRVQVEAVGEVVSLGDVRVAVGDWIVADEDGVVVIRHDRAGEVFERALALRAAEERIVAATLAGASLTEARSQVDYHKLQRWRG
jgi:regulator of RNase E activity RraA